jgi:hypothetical protein
MVNVQNDIPHRGICRRALKRANPKLAIDKENPKDTGREQSSQPAP